MPELPLALKMYQGQISLPGRALSGLLFPAQCEHPVLSVLSKTLLQTSKCLEIFKGENLENQLGFSVST